MKLLQFKPTAKIVLLFDVLCHVVLVVTFFLSLYNLSLLQPVITNSFYSAEKVGIWNTFTFPLETTTDIDEKLRIQWNMQWSKFKPTTYVFIPDDCIDSIRINNKIVEDSALPFCDYDYGRSINVKEYLVPGENSFDVVLHNSGGKASLEFTVSTRDIVFQTLQAVFYVTLAIIIWQLLQLRFINIQYVYLRIAILIGLLLRVYYFTITSYWERAHDVGGHIEYIKILMSNVFTLPGIHDGWVLYHPPLYYFFAALWGKMFTTNSYNENIFLRVVQMQSLLYSIITFGLCIWIASMIFQKHQKHLQTIFILLCASFTGLVFFTARINNDVLVVVFQIGFLGIVLHWWKNKQMRYWYLALIIACLAILTKTSSLLLLPILGLCLVGSRQPVRAILTHGCIAAIIVAATTGWFFYIRFYIEASRDLAGNINNLTSALALPNIADILTQFNPLKLIRSPYIEAFNPESGREYFWEYWWKSALFGEFNHGNHLRTLASAVMTMSMFVIVLCIRGIIVCLRKWHNNYLPIFVTGGIILFGHVVYRFLAPFSPSQDFRYSILSIIPILYFTVMGADTLHGYYKKIAISGLIIFTALEILFILKLGF